MRANFRRKLTGHNSKLFPANGATAKNSLLICATAFCYHEATQDSTLSY